MRRGRGRNSVVGVLVFVAAVGYGAYDFFQEKKADEDALEALGTRIEIQGSGFYYSDAVTEDQARALADTLEGAGFFSQQKVSVRLDCDGETWIFQTVIVDGMMAKQHTSIGLTFFAAELGARVLDGALLEVHLCKDLRSPAVRTVSNAGMRQSVERNGCLLVHGDTVDASEATRVADFLAAIGFLDTPGSTLHLAKQQDIWQLRSIAQPGIEQDGGTQAAFQDLAAKVSAGALGGARVEFHLFDPRSDRWMVIGSEPEKG